MRKNQQGSVLLWAIIVIMVILISLGACLGISFSYFNRALQKQVNQQAYFTAHSAMMAVVKALSDETQENIDKFIPEKVGDFVIIEKIEFTDQNGAVSAIGSARAGIEKIKDKQIRIAVKGTMGGVDYVLYGDVAYQMDPVSKKNKWTLVQLYTADNELIIEDK